MIFSYEVVEEILYDFEEREYLKGEGTFIVRVKLKTNRYSSRPHNL